MSWLGACRLWRALCNNTGSGSEEGALGCTVTRRLRRLRVLEPFRLALGRRSSGLLLLLKLYGSKQALL